MTARKCPLPIVGSVLHRSPCRQAAAAGRQIANLLASGAHTMTVTLDWDRVAILRAGTNGDSTMTKIAELWPERLKARDAYNRACGANDDGAIEDASEVLERLEAVIMQTPARTLAELSMKAVVAQENTPEKERDLPAARLANDVIVLCSRVEHVVKTESSWQIFCDELQEQLALANAYADSIDHRVPVNMSRPPEALLTAMPHMAELLEGLATLLRSAAAIRRCRH